MCRLSGFLPLFVCLRYNRDMENTIFAGTYTAKTSEGIYRFTCTDGKLSEAELFTKIRNPKYITVQDDMITSLGDFDNGSGVALINSNGNIVSQLAYEERTSCYVTRKGDRIYTANYHTGTVSLLKEEEGNLKLIRSYQIQDGAGCHQVLLWNDKVLVPCLFLDRIVIMDEDLNSIEDSIRFNHGTGPRHGVFTADNQYLYLVSELSNELFVIHTGDWKIETSISVLPNGLTHQRDTAAIRLSENESHIYVSTRTLNILSVIEVEDHNPTLVQNIFCGGKHPRDFILCGKYLLCANRHSDEVVSFELEENGTIGDQVSSTHVPEAVSLAME